MLNENSNNTHTNGKNIQKKKHIPDTNVVLLNSETVILKSRFDNLSVNNNKFIERTRDKEIDDNAAWQKQKT